MKTIKLLVVVLLTVFITSCVQEAQPKKITVLLNMQDVEQPKNVGIRGEYPLSWEETTYLEDTNNDGIYEGKFNIYTASNSIQFKFVNENDQFELKDQKNRTLTFEYKPETIQIEAIFDDPVTKISKTTPSN